MKESEINKLQNPLRLMQVHAHYQQSGGEDQVLAAEYKLLSQHHYVSQFIRHNRDLKSMSRLKQVESTVWNSKMHRDFIAALHQEKPDLIHVHNTFPVISPSIYYAAASMQIPVVQTLHNYRLLCVNAILYRNENICEDCIGRIPWQGVLHRCYRNSFPASGVSAGLIMIHRGLHTWQDKVDLYISLTGFAKSKFIQAGFAAERIVVKPNFVPDPGSSLPEGESYALFVGRLTPEKGLETLLKAWQVISKRLPLKIIGTGPMEEHVRAAVLTNPSIQYLGQQEPTVVQQFMRRASVLVFPSLWYEGCPMTIIEAFSHGLPVISSRLGSAGELVISGRTGLHFTPGSEEELIAQVIWLMQHPSELVQMRHHAREEYLKKYTSEQNYHQLISAYRLAIEQKKQKYLTKNGH
jgi:glycosyltransferase involved in cell wall biosynthesis